MGQNEIFMELQKAGNNGLTTYELSKRLKIKRGCVSKSLRGLINVGMVVRVLNKKNKWTYYLKQNKFNNFNILGKSKKRVMTR